MIYIDNTGHMVADSLKELHELRIVEIYENSHKHLIYFVGKKRANTIAAMHAIERGLVKSIGENRYEITFEGRKLYSQAHTHS